MKNKSLQPPVVSCDLWQELYEQSFLYESLEPWTFLNEDQIFAFANPSTKEVGYCCILGRCEGFFGLSVYRGREGVEMYFQLKRREIDPKGIDVLHRHNALVAECVEDRKTLDKEDLRVTKSLHLSFKNRKMVPCFRSYLPGFKGWFLTEEEVKFLTLGFKCAIWHLSNNPTILTQFTLEKMTCPLYLPKLDENGISWGTTTHAITPLMEKNSPVLSLDGRKIDTLKETKLCHDTAWEVSVLNTSNVLLDHSRPYLAKICMIVHQETLLILDIKPASIGCNLPEFLSEQLLFAIKKHKRIPGEILFNDKSLQIALKPLTKALGIQGTLVDVLMASIPVQESLLEYMQ